MLILRGGRVVDPSRGLDETADVVIEKGRISRVGRGAGGQQTTSDQVRVVDATGKWIVPGFVDMHVHFREPGQEYKEDIASGLRAAAWGGFTTVCAMPNTKPVNDTRAITEMMVARAKECGGPRLFPIAAITKGSEGQALTEMADLREAGAVGVSDDGKCVMNAAVMRRALEYASTFDLLLSQHAEDHDLTSGAQMNEGAVATRLGLRGWPRVAEDVIVARDLLLAEATRAKYHVAHVSSFGSVRLLREAKSRGMKVSAEVTPHHLMLTDDAVVGYDTACKVNPPLRTAEDRAALRDALRDGTIDCIATDHAPHSSLEKDLEFQEASPGMIGLETAFAALLELVHAGDLPLMRFIEAMSTNPAKLIGVEGGTLREGARADVTVIDPDAQFVVSRETLASKSLNTPWLGKSLRGRIQMTIVGGQVVSER